VLFFNMKTDLQFKIVVVYENLQAALRAREMCERLALELRHEGGIQCALWKFDLLGHPSLMAQATAEAVAAGMVIVAAHSTGLPAQLKNWIEHWPVPTRQNRAALVVLLDDQAADACGTAPLTTYLSDVARIRGTDFFCKAGGWWGRELKPINDFFSCRRNPPGAPAHAARSLEEGWPDWNANDLPRSINQPIEPKLNHASIKQIQRPGFPRTNGSTRPPALGTSGPA